MFEPVEEHNLTKIAVFGVGGAGGNAVNHMIQSGLTGVDFYALNTDKQVLQVNLAENKLQLGAQITGGIGSSGSPEIGRKACEETLPLIREILIGYDLLFIVAGEGGGTGTGASPLIAEAARQQGTLVVAVVTKPFDFESRIRMQRALQGIEELRARVDTLIVIPNKKVLEVYKQEPVPQAFRLADEVLCSAVRGIAEIVAKPQLVNIDFSDVRAVLQEGGGAILGMSTASGTDRAQEAAEHAIYPPLVEDLSIETARRILMNVSGGEDMTLDEVRAAVELVLNATKGRADIRFGVSIDNMMAGKIKVTVIATGIDEPLSSFGASQEFLNFKDDLVARRRRLTEGGGANSGLEREDLQIPAILRRHID